MKSKDIVPLLIIIVISSVLAYIASSIFIDSTPESREVETVRTIKDDFPDEATLKEIFHDKIIDTFGNLSISEEE